MIEATLETTPEAEPFADEIRAFEDADRKKMPEPGGVLFLGSSSIALWETLEQDFGEFKVLNRGFGGSIIEQSTLYAPRIVWPYAPRLIVFYAGDNDLASDKSAPQVLGDFQTFVARVREKLPQTSIAFISIKPSPLRVHIKSEAMSANALIRAEIEARREQGLRFIDVWTAMTDDSGQARAELFGPDDLHMNPTGYALWTALIKPHLHAVLGEARDTVEGAARSGAEVRN